MRYFISLAALLFCVTVAQAQGAPTTATLHLDWTPLASGTTVTVPATSYRVEENVGGVWGNLSGTTAPTIILPPAGSTVPPKKFDVVVPVATSHTYRVFPIANGLDGPVTNSVVSGAFPSDEKHVLGVTITVP